MKKIVGIIAAFALVAGTVFADPEVAPVVTSLTGNAGLEYVVDLNAEKSGFVNNTWTEFKIQFKSGDWGGKSTSGDGLWGELNVRTEGDVTLEAPASAWDFGKASVGTAKLHFIDGDTYLHMDLLKPSFKIGELQGAIALYNHGWDPVQYMLGIDPTDDKYNGFQLNFGVPVIDVSLAFGDRGSNTKTKDQKYAYKAAATVKPIDGLAIGLAFASTTEDKAKQAIAANLAYSYQIDDTFYLKPYVNYNKLDKKSDLDAILLFGWGGSNAQWCHDFLKLSDSYVGNNTYATDGLSVRFTKGLTGADGKSIKASTLQVAAYDSVLVNKVLPGDTKTYALYNVSGEKLGKGKIEAGIIYGNKVDILNITARATFEMDLAKDKDNSGVAYGLKLNTTEVIQNTDLYIDWAGSTSKLNTADEKKKGTIKAGAKISF